MDLKAFVSWLKTTIENTATAAVKSLKTNTYTVKLDSNKVEVTNPVKIPSQFDVKVINPTKDSAKEINSVKEELSKASKDIQAKIAAITIPDTVKVSNLKESPKPLDTVSVKNFPKQIDVANLSVVVKALQAMQKVLEKLPKEYPKAPDKVTVANQVDYAKALKAIQSAIEAIKPASFTDIDIRSDKAESYVPVRLTDGKKFYKALEDFAVSMGAVYTFSDSTGKRMKALLDHNRSVVVSAGERWSMNHSETSGDTTVVGSEDSDGNWLLTKAVKTGTVTAMTYATIRNNTTVTSYNQAWEARLSLTFSTAGSAL